MNEGVVARAQKRFLETWSGGGHRNEQENVQMFNDLGLLWDLILDVGTEEQVKNCGRFMRNMGHPGAPPSDDPIGEALDDAEADAWTKVYFDTYPEEYPGDEGWIPGV